MKSKLCLSGRILVLAAVFAASSPILSASPGSVPTALDNAYYIPEGIEFVVSAPGVLGNDTDADEDRMSALLDVPPSNGVLSLRSNGGFSYIPAPGFVGTDSFSYHAHDGTFSSNVTSVSIHVVASPLASLNNGSFELQQWDQPTGWKVSGNLSCSAGIEDGSHGFYRIEFNGGNRVPNGKISQVVRTEPGQKYALSFDAGVLSYGSGHQRMGVKISDLSTDGSTPYSTSYSETHTLTGSGNGVTRWVPGQVTFIAKGFFTELSFSDQSTTTVNIDLLLDYVRLERDTSTVNGVPVVSADAYSTPKNTPLVITGTGVLANDIDPENSPLVAVKTGNGPVHGSLTWSAAGPFTRGGFVYTPDAGFLGIDSFSYYATDGTARSGPTTVTITTTPAPDVAPSAAPDQFSADQDQVLEVLAPGVLANDSDPNFDQLDAILVEGPGHGTLALRPGGGFRYSPQPGYTGPDSFSYRTSDGEASSGVATVEIDVLLPSILRNGSFESGVDPWQTGLRNVGRGGIYQPTDGARLLEFQSTDDRSGQLIYQGCETDPGQSYHLSFDIAVCSSSTNPHSMEVSMHHFLPGFDYLAGLTFSETFGLASYGGVDAPPWLRKSFNFRAKASTTSFQLSHVSGISPGDKILIDNVRITKVLPSLGNNVPVAMPDHYVTNPGKQLAIAGQVLANDTDAENDILKAVVVTQPVHGTVGQAWEGGGDPAGFYYVPTPGFVGTDSFTYYATDGTLRSAPTTVTISVIPPVTWNLNNGNFETGLWGWTVSPGVSRVNSGDIVAASGSALVVMDGPDTQLSQTFPTIAGMTYRLNFAVGLRDTASTQAIRVSVLGVSELLSKAVSISGAASGTRWFNQTFTFVADSATTVLSFSRGLTSPMGRLLLDDVRVTNMTALDAVLATQTFTGSPGDSMIKLMAAEAGLYRIERSCDLRTWGKIGEVVVLSPGPVEFRDTEPLSPAEPSRFYRIAYPLEQ
ncbi:MAG: tandem-95 repeat protein [Verrucomicrobiaceae bacterium]|nr:MAG: tandem-95 repeat protein [Verrucomicrobiaceae bacterium]